MTARQAQRPKSPASRDETRIKLIRAIRAAARRAGVGDDDRRDLQRELTGKASMSDMTAPELGRLLDHFNRDWKRPDRERGHVGKIRALWWSLYWLGAIDRPDDEALTLFVRRQTGIERLAFLDHRRAPSVIEALKAWLEREGVQWWSTEQLAAVTTADPEFQPANADRHAVLAAIGQGLSRAGIMRCASIYDWVSSWLRHPLHNQWSMGSAELDAAIREFGKKLRRAREDGAR